MIQADIKAFIFFLFFNLFFPPPWKIILINISQLFLFDLFYYGLNSSLKNKFNYFAPDLIRLKSHFINLL